jgi:ribosomal protein L18, bacterial type
MATRSKLFSRRRNRVRNQIRKTSKGKPRLSVFRSGRHIYAQVIDDASGVTVASASTVEKDLRVSSSVNVESASRVGSLVAERSLAAGVDTVVFDRGGFIYHGRVKSLADAAREAGLKF